MINAFEKLPPEHTKVLVYDGHAFLTLHREGMYWNDTQGMVGKILRTDWWLAQ